MSNSIISSDYDYVNVDLTDIDFVVSSANKCLQVPYIQGNLQQDII